MERDNQKEIQDLIPNVQIPAIQLMPFGEYRLFVQMNVRSLIYTSLDKSQVIPWEGFTFEVKMPGYRMLPLKYGKTWNEYIHSWLNLELSVNSLPTIELVGEFPIIYHPHFFVGYDQNSRKIQNGKWYDFKKQGFEKKLGDYLLRIAHSLKYEEGYIDVSINIKYCGNPEALRYYQENLNLFPTDHTPLPTQLPGSKNFQVKSFYEKENRQPKFVIKEGNTPLQNSNLQTTTHQLQLPSRKLKFEIIERKPPYSPREQLKPDLKVLDSSDDRRWKLPLLSKDSHEFYITSTAFDTISEHIGWGKITDYNRVEQGGILLGHTFIDKDQKLTYAVAEQAIEGKLAIGSAGYLEVTHETWKEMLDQVDRLHTDLQIIGWYHTHPGFEVFMSGTDRTTQEKLFNNDWQFAIVLNPHNKIWRAFYGSRSDECKGFIIQKYTYILGHTQSDKSITSDDVNGGLNG